MSLQSSGTTGVLTARAEEHEGISVVVVSGELDRVPEDSPLLATLDVLRDTPPAGLVIDLAEVTFFGSAGINLLVTVLRQAKSCRVPFAVVAGTRTVLRPLEICGVDALLSLHADLRSALTALRSLPTQRQR